MQVHGMMRYSRSKARQAYIPEGRTLPVPKQCARRHPSQSVFALTGCIRHPHHAWTYRQA